MEIITSNKGNDKITFKGHMFVIKHEGKKYYSWRCSKKSSLNCPAILHTSIHKTHKYGMAYLKNIVPEDAETLLIYFDTTYVNGKYRHVRNENNRIVLRNCPPIFPPNL